MSTIRAIYSAEPSFPSTDQHPDAVRYQVGGHWVDAIGGQPTSDEVDAILSPVPASVTPLQARRALDQTNLRNLVEDWIDTQPRSVRDEWDYASEVRRDNATITSAAAALGITSEQIDGLFRLAATL